MATTAIITTTTPLIRRSALIARNCIENAYDRAFLHAAALVARRREVRAFEDQESAEPPDPDPADWALALSAVAGLSGLAGLSGDGEATDTGLAGLSGDGLWVETGLAGLSGDGLWVETGLAGLSGDGLWVDGADWTDCADGAESVESSGEL